MMKRTLLFVIFFLATGNVFGQTEPLVNKSVAAAFELFYNHNNYDSIFTMFSPEMSSALPIDKTREFLSGLKNQCGQILSRKFIGLEQSYATYKTRFEKAELMVNISVDSNANINGLFIKPVEDENLPVLTRNTTKLLLPFHGEWTVTWGGDTKELNYHVESKAQKNAFDFVMHNEKENSFRTNGKTNEDYYAFGQEILAPCNAEVVTVVDGIKDNIPGKFNPIYIPGNTVILKTSNGEYLFFAHFKQRSIRVKEGQKVRQGEVLGLCGNSGNSSEPHLHFHIQNVEDMNVATGAKCYFDTIMVNGQVKTDYSPIQKEKISNKTK